MLCGPLELQFRASEKAGQHGRSAGVTLVRCYTRAHSNASAAGRGAAYTVGARLLARTAALPFAFPPSVHHGAMQQDSHRTVASCALE